MSPTSRIKEEKFSPSFPVCMTTEELKESLRYFLSTTESCIGPRASLKMIVSGTGNLMTTSSSHRLWDLIQVMPASSWLILFILASDWSILLKLASDWSRHVINLVSLLSFGKQYL